ncbi:MAG: aminoglycoside phosphotransferase family protein [Lewinella sp.]
MKQRVTKIFKKELNEVPLSVMEIAGYGTVNSVFMVACQSVNYVIRLNEEEGKHLEFIKEEWCINEARKAGVPSPIVIANGVFEGTVYMIQEQLEGVNGSTCSKKDKELIWEYMGRYASKYHRIKDIAIPALKEAEFHDDWGSKLAYNINQLNADDSLLLSDALNPAAHTDIRRILISLREKDFDFGLIHGDLSPRNTIVNASSTYLIDWGTASVNVVPHNEIGILLMEGEVGKKEFLAFLKGMGASEQEYREMELEVWKLNLLHRLDKYRWATDYKIEDLMDFTMKVKKSYEKVVKLETR